MLGEVFKAAMKFESKRGTHNLDIRDWRFSRMVLTEMIMRCVKNVIRGVMRRTTNELHLKTEVLLHFNRLLGESSASELYFDLLVRSQLILKFEPGSWINEMQRNLVMTHVIKLQLYQTLQVKLGLTFVM